MNKLLLILALLGALAVRAQIVTSGNVRFVGNVVVDSTPGATAVPFALIGFASLSNSVTTFHNTNSLPANTFVVVCAANENAATDSTMSDGSSLTWTKRGDASNASTGNAEVFTALFSAGGTLNITNNWGAHRQSSTVYYFQGAEGGTTNTAINQSDVSIGATSTKAASYLLVVSSDWNGYNGAVTLLDSATLTKDFNFGGSTRHLYYYKLTTSVGAYTEGTSSGNNLDAGSVIYEVRTTQ